MHFFVFSDEYDCNIEFAFKALLLPLQQAEAVEVVLPLLDPLVHCRNGELILPGNTTLVSLNLAGQWLRCVDPFTLNCFQHSYT